MTDIPARPARFPWCGALLCVACLSAAAWMWMRYSYCWDFEARGPGKLALVSLDAGPDYEAAKPWRQRLTSPHDWPVHAYARNWENAGWDRGRIAVAEESRDFDGPYQLLVVVDEGRFHPASIAGLVVGAMGVFVFTVALRRWLRERRGTSWGVETVR